MTDQSADTPTTEEVMHPLHRSSTAGVRATTDLGRAFWAIGREVALETRDHVSKVVRARNVRELAELHAAYLQHRLEMSATYTKEIFDLASLHASEVLTPVRELTSREKSR